MNRVWDSADFTGSPTGRRIRMAVRDCLLDEQITALWWFTWLQMWNRIGNRP